MPRDGDATERQRAGHVITLTPLGTAAAFGGAGEAQRSYLVEAGGRAVVMDLGSGSLAVLARLRPPESVDAVLVSHMHPDHCVDLFGLRVHMLWGPGRGGVIPVLGPPELPARMAAFAGSDGPWADGEGLRFEPLAAGGGRRDLGGPVLTHAEVPHLPPTHAMRIDWEGASLCYGADCAANDALVELAQGCDVLLAECSFGADPVPEGLPHLNADAAGDIARRARVGRLLLTHCQGGHDRDAALRRAQEAFGGPVEWATPGVAVTL